MQEKKSKKKKIKEVYNPMPPLPEYSELPQSCLAAPQCARLSRRIKGCNYEVDIPPDQVELLHESLLEAQAEAALLGMAICVEPKTPRRKTRTSGTQPATVTYKVCARLAMGPPGAAAEVQGADAAHDGQLSPASTHSSCGCGCLGCLGRMFGKWQ